MWEEVYRVDLGNFLDFTNRFEEEIIYFFLLFWLSVDKEMMHGALAVILR